MEKYIIDENTPVYFLDNVKEKYVFTYRKEDDGFYESLFINIYFGDQLIGESDFIKNIDEAYCQNIIIDVNHRRKKLANCTYVLAEHLFENPLSNFWENDSYQSEDAKLLWAQINRPFGNS